MFVGVVFVVATLTKTTGPFVLPAVLFPIWANNRDRINAAAWKLLATALATIILLMGIAKIVWARHYSAGRQIILAVWRRCGSLENSPSRLLRFFFRGTWIDPVLFPLALAAFIAAAVRLRFLWRNPLFMIAFLWETGYAAFIVYHYDGPPRYFVTMIVPTIWLALIFPAMDVEREQACCRGRNRLRSCVCRVEHRIHRGLSASSAVHPGRRKPEIKKLIAAATPSKQPATNELLIGRGADEISLLSGGFPRWTATVPCH